MTKTFARRFLFALSSALLALFVLVHHPKVIADQQCIEIRDRRFPGLTQCNHFISPEKAFATPPSNQKMSLWCWAASLSIAFTMQGHPISQEDIVVQNFGRLVTV